MKSPNNILRRILEDMKALRCAIDEIIACNPCGGGGSPTVGLLDVMPGTNITIDKTNPLKPIINAVWGGAVNGELIKVIENGKAGYGLRGVDTSVFGNTGTDAFNFGKSTTVSSTKGATGDRAVNFGLDNTTSKSDSLTLGNNNQNNGKNSLVSGKDNKLNADLSTYEFGNNVVFGDNNILQGAIWNNFIAGGTRNIVGRVGYTQLQSAVYNSIISGRNNLIEGAKDGLYVGVGLKSRSAGVSIIGVANEDISPDIATSESTSIDGLKPRFIVGVGTVVYNNDVVLTRANGFVVMSDGTASFPSLTNLMIDNSDGKSAVTKDWVIANSGGGGGVQSVTGDGVSGTPEDVVLTFPTPSEIGALDKVFADYTTIAAMIADQANQTDQTVYAVADASDDPTLNFAPGERKKQGFYRYTDGYHMLISAPYSTHNSGGGGDVPNLQEVTDEGNTTTNGISAGYLRVKESLSDFTLALLDSRAYPSLTGDRGYLRLGGNMNFIEITSENASGVNTLKLPNEDGTIATREYVDRKEIKTISATTYTLLEEDNNKILNFTSSIDVTITVPAGLTVGNRYEGKQRGDGQLIFVGDTGVTVNVGASETNKTLEKFSVWGLDCVAEDEYDLFGKLELI